MVQITPAQKIRAVLSTITNWYMIPVDKIGIRDTILYRFRNGTTLKCRCRSTDINEAVVVQAGLEYPVEQCIFANGPSSRPLVLLDLGGNIGAFSVWIRALNPKCDLRLHIFEPHPGNISILEENLRINCVANAQIYEVAVAGESGIVKLDVSQGFDAFTINSTSGNAIDVQAISIRDFLFNQGIFHVDLLKMDIEGAEFDIIAHDFEVLAATVSRMIVEFHGSPSSSRVIEMIAKLKTRYNVSIVNSHEGGGVAYASREQGASSAKPDQTTIVKTM